MDEETHAHPATLPHTRSAKYTSVCCLVTMYLNCLSRVVFFLQGSAKLLGGARGLALSNDASTLFVAAYSDSAISEFRIDAQFGNLTFIDSIAEGDKRLAAPVELRRNVFETSEAPTSVLAAVSIHILNFHLMVFAGGVEGVSVYRWNANKGKFHLYQVLNEANAVDVQHSRVGGASGTPPVDFLIAVNGESSDYAPVAVYRWNTSHFVHASILENDRDINGNMRYGSAAATFSVSRTQPARKALNSMCM
jgi:hypothetical protein